MTTKQLLKKMTKHTWWIEESPATHQIAEWAFRGFVESSKYFDKKHLSFGLFFYKNDFGSEITSRQEKIKQFYFALNKYKKDKKYLEKFRRQCGKKSEKMVGDGWKFLKDVKKMKGKEIASEYKKLTDRYLDFGRYTAFIECVDPFTEDILPKLMDKYFPEISQNEKNKIAAIMSAPEVLSFMEYERIKVLGGCVKALKDKKSIDNLACELENKYHWIATYYGAALSKTAKKFKKEILGIIRKKTKKEIERELDGLKKKTSQLKKDKRKLVREYKINDLKIIFNLVAEMGAWIDERKAYAMQMTFIIYRLVEIFSHRLRYSKELLAYTTWSELYRWLSAGKMPVQGKELKERRKFSVYVVKLKSAGKSEAEFITGAGANAIYNAIFVRKRKKVSEFKGTVASAPVKIVKGEASVVFNSMKDKFKAGNILVTTMTRPDFLPLMRRAKAIITDEGGLTCHAAIVSREMGKPCIIGTKIATKTIKSGNTAEMNMENGVVKIIKR